MDWMTIDVIARNEWHSNEFGGSHVTQRLLRSKIPSVLYNPYVINDFNFITLHLQPIREITRPPLYQQFVIEIYLQMKNPFSPENSISLIYLRDVKNFVKKKKTNSRTRIRRSIQFNPEYCSRLSQFLRTFFLPPSNSWNDERHIVDHRSYALPALSVACVCGCRIDYRKNYIFQRSCFV